MDTYWLSSSNVIDTGSQSAQTTTKPKDDNVGTITNSTMASFANIFAGASAAIASSANINSDIMVSKKTVLQMLDI